MKNLVLLLLMLGALACAGTPESKEPAPEKSANIILLIGDGMGLSAVSTSFYYGEGLSSFYRFKHIGMVKTSSATDKVTDSAASGTAMATGIKTYNKAIGVDTLKMPVTNIIEVVSQYGWSTGVVVTSSITNATPASFYAHVENRYTEEEVIAAQLLDSEIDFFAGAGIRFFNRREDGKNLFESAAEKGFVMDTSGLLQAGSMQADHKYGFLLSYESMPSMLQGREDFLPEATSLALEQLSKDKDGFFLMVEGSQIDGFAHDNEADNLIAEVLDFEKAIAVALDFAEKDGNTLVVVTADHETGGFTLSEKKDEETGHKIPQELGPTFATGGHSATLIPVFAYGPGASEFMGIYENTGLFHKMAALAGNTQ